MNNKIVLITGGTKGLGLELAKSFKSRNFIVVITGRKKKEVQKIAKENDFIGEVCDVTKETENKKLIQKVERKYKKIDIIINNAGVWYPHTKATEVEMKKVKKVFDTNVFGLINISKIILKVFEKQKAGTLVNIISTSALSGRPLSSIYAASKWAVRGFTESIIEEYKNTNIKIISIYPGGMQTNLFDENKPENLKDYMNPKDVADKIVENILSENPKIEQVINRPNK